MKAHVGDRLVVKAHNVGQKDRPGEVIEVHGESGEPPYVVRWLDDGHEGLIYPGSDVVIEKHGRRRGKTSD
jgi:hypothetical protein